MVNLRWRLQQTSRHMFFTWSMNVQILLLQILYTFQIRGESKPKLFVDDPLARLEEAHNVTRSVPTSQSVAAPATREMQPMHGTTSCRLVTTFLYAHKAHFVFIRLCIGTPFSSFVYVVPTGCQRHAQRRIKQTVCVIGLESIL